MKHLHTHTVKITERFTRNIFLYSIFINRLRSRIPQRDDTKINQTSSSEPIQYTLRAGFPQISNTQSQHSQQQINNRYPSPSTPIQTNPINPNTNKRYNYNNNNRDANKFKTVHDSDHSQSIKLTTGFRLNSNSNYYDKNVDIDTDNSNRTVQNLENDTIKPFRPSYATKTPTNIVMNHNHNQNNQNNNNNNNNRENDGQESPRKKYLDFIVSDTQPQSFQAPATTRAVNHNTKPLTASEKELVNAFVNSQKSLFIQSTPKSHVITTIPNKNQQQTESQPIQIFHPSPSPSPTSSSSKKQQKKNETVQFILTSDLSATTKHSNRNRTSDAREHTTQKNRSKQHHTSQASSEIVPLYVRKPQSSSITPLKNEIIIPTTYSPLRNWKIQYLKKPVLPGSEVFNSVVDALAPNDFKEAILSNQTHSTEPQTKISSTTPKIISKFSYKFQESNENKDKEYNSVIETTKPDEDFLKTTTFGAKNRTKSIEYIPTIASSTSKIVSKFSYTFDGDKDYERHANSNRQPTKFPSIKFRERLNRTYDTTTSKPLVSPYASLQTILNDEHDVDDVKPTQYRPSYSVPSNGPYSVTIGKTKEKTKNQIISSSTTAATIKAPSFVKNSYFIITNQPKKSNLSTSTTTTASTPITNTQITYSSTENKPISIADNNNNNYSPISSPSAPYGDWTPISSPAYSNQQIQQNTNQYHIQQTTNDVFTNDVNRFKPLQSTEKPIIHITTVYPERTNHYESNFNSVHSPVSNYHNTNNNNNNDYRIRTTTPISITTSTTPISITTSEPLFDGLNTPREHYRKVVRMRSKKKLVNNSGGFRPYILDPNVQQLGEGDPEVDGLKDSGLLNIMETVLDNEENVEHTTKPIIRKKPSKTPEVVLSLSTYRTRPGKLNQNLPPSDYSVVSSLYTEPAETTPTKYYSNYRHVKNPNEDEEDDIESDGYNNNEHGGHTLGDYIRNHASIMEESNTGGDILSENEPIASSTENEQQKQQREKFRATVEMPEFNVPTESEIKARLKQLEREAERDVENEEHYETTTNVARAFYTENDITNDTIQHRNHIDYEVSTNDYRNLTYVPLTMFDSSIPTTTNNNLNSMTSTQTQLTSTTQRSYSTTNSINSIPSRASRVNPAIKTTIAANPTRRMHANTSSALRFNHHTTPIMKCIDSKCNEIPSR